MLHRKTCMMLFLAFLGANILYSLIDVLVISIAAFYFNVAIEKISLFARPCIIKFHFGDTLVSLGIIPVGSSIQFYSSEEDSNSFLRLNHTFSSSKRLNFFEEDLNALQRIVVILSPLVVTLVISAIILSPHQATSAFVGGFGEIIRGVFDSEYARFLIGRAKEMIDSQGFFATMTVLLLKFASLNHFPFIPFRGSRVLKELVTLLTKRKIRIPELLSQISIFVALGIAIKWSLNFVAFALLPIILQTSFLP